MSIATEIAAVYDDDDDDITAVITAVCAARAPTSADIRDRGTDAESRRYDFADGSALVVGSDGWDLGLPGGCHCWAGAGHTDECRGES